MKTLKKPVHIGVFIQKIPLMKNIGHCFALFCGSFSSNCFRPEPFPGVLLLASSPEAQITQEEVEPGARVPLSNALLSLLDKHTQSSVHLLPYTFVFSVRLWKAGKPTSWVSEEQ